MKATHRSTFSVSIDSSKKFARLSGDFNPLHTDAFVARRTRFGETVVHGVHLLLLALDALARDGYLSTDDLKSLSATFNDAVLTGQSVSVLSEIDADGIHLRAESRNRFVFSASLEPAARTKHQPEFADEEFAPMRPIDSTFPPSTCEGNAALRLSRTLFAELFPSLCSMSSKWAGDLLGTTQIVGMHCPGLHSIYSGLKLHQNVQPSMHRAIMRYRVTGLEHRFHMLRIEVSGCYLGGVIECFYRPRPIVQPSIIEVARTVRTDEYVGNRVLIIGGSRGLGELTAKITAAGGAEVTITYCRGKADAERVADEACSVGRFCDIQYLDVDTLPVPDWLQQRSFTHVYFFASPSISKSAGAWDDAKFQRFARTYVTSFAHLSEQIIAASKSVFVRFLYPSSIYVARAELGFAEYAVAKAAGEALCDQLRLRHRAQFSYVRLPRMLTDQTNSTTGSDALEPLPTMLGVVRMMHSST